ncbi:hypothetical protein HBH98_110220 [Parastagonospora nodorum]|nr:hypothetical protein HBI95_061460 [Parastagonospora nodorum]KAH4267701.1 hypothetical protein HBI03_065330 [Parastagonospora nodorum]KAH4273212.1 hypothetical protein HBI04_135150 [Parastagonospora nodorum]KAH4346081.1 hypothetical protein HBH98_110220 [Parastagonospora nodorum]KAH4376744.1 hypothetical protein HBH97_112980 [Parastagonospora nodorum]
MFQDGIVKCPGGRSWSHLPEHYHPRAKRGHLCLNLGYAVRTPTFSAQFLVLISASCWPSRCVCTITQLGLCVIGRSNHRHVFAEVATVPRNWFLGRKWARDEVKAQIVSLGICQTPPLPMGYTRASSLKPPLLTPRCRKRGRAGADPQNTLSSNLG